MFSTNDGDKRPSRIVAVLSVAFPLAMAIGLGFLAWPMATDWYYTWEAEHAISSIVDVYDDMSDADRLDNLAQAQGWNARLRGEDPGLELWEYQNQLTYRSTPDSMMAWLDVPKIGTRLPVYHGTGAAELTAGVGHCDWSALPVGGQGSHCVLTAHSGMQGTRMFDDIRALEEGDVFVVWSLGEPYAYRVCEIGVYLPQEALEHLRSEAGRDLCTLVTCTPFGVNSHRLLVTGSRCAYMEELGQTTGVEPWLNRRTIPLLAGIAVVVLVLVATLAIRLRRKETSV